MTLRSDSLFHFAGRQPGTSFVCMFDQPREGLKVKAEAKPPRERVDWKPQEWLVFFDLMDRVTSAPNAPKEKARLVRDANAQMERPRTMKASADCSDPWKKYQEYKTKGRVIVGRGHEIRGNQIKFTNGQIVTFTAAPPVAAAAVPPPVAAPVSPPVAAAAVPPPVKPSVVATIKASVDNPYPHLGIPPIVPSPAAPAAPPRPGARFSLLTDVESDGPPPPTLFDECVSWFSFGLKKAIAGVFDDSADAIQIEQGLQRWRDILLGNIEAREAKRDPAVFDEKERGPRIVVAGFKPDLNHRLKQHFKGRANIAIHEQHKSNIELKNMLRGNYDKIDALICARFMNHPAHNMAKAMMREKYFWNDGGLTTAIDKIEQICQNWTRRELANTPRAGSMSAEAAD
jgi:hypothetical protein